MFIISVCHRCIFLSYDGSFRFHSLVYTISVNFCRKNNFLKKMTRKKSRAYTGNYFLIKRKRQKYKIDNLSIHTNGRKCKKIT